MQDLINYHKTIFDFDTIQL